MPCACPPGPLPQHTHTQSTAPDSCALRPAAALKRQLVELQSEVAEAHQRLHLTQARVEQNLRRISELKEESARLGDAMQRARAPEAQPAAAGDANVAAASGIAAGPAEAGAAPAPALQQRSRELASAAHPAAPGHSGPARSACGGAGPAAARQGAEQQRRRGLHSSLDMEEGLKNHWFAVAFVSKLGKVSFVGAAGQMHGGAQAQRCCSATQHCCMQRCCMAPVDPGRVYFSGVALARVLGLLPFLCRCVTSARLPRPSVLALQSRSPRHPHPDPSAGRHGPFRALRPGLGAVPRRRRPARLHPG